MNRKPGRPPGAKNKVGKSEKEFISYLLDITQPQYEEELTRMANSNDKKEKARFMNIRTELSKMIVPKPVEVDANIKEEDFKNLLGLFAQYDEA